MFHSFLILLFLTTAVNGVTNFPIVTTSFGSIRGYEYTDEAGFRAEIFKKIPFAKPPVGDLRWKKPVAPDEWEEMRDGTFFGPACPQRSVKYAGPATGFSEDCLHLNIYTAAECRESNASCPVVFYLHGGNGLFGSTMKSPDEIMIRNFASQGVIIVSAAYRLGLFGIMALGDENVVPANLAIHDVLAALRFVKDEIHAFGGDSKQITLLGHSTGAQLIYVIAYTPAIKNRTELFQNVVIMSGSVALFREEEQIQKTHRITDLLGCKGSATEIVECLRPKSTDEIADAVFEIVGESTLNFDELCGMTIAGELLPIQSEQELYTNVQPLRLMLGTTMYEMATPGDLNIVNRVMGLKNDEECYGKFINDSRSGEYDFLSWNTASQAMIMTTWLFANNQAKGGQEVYLYEYDYPVHGYHTDDVSYVFGLHTFEKDENEDWLSRVYPLYFTNFIKGHRPAPNWYTLKPTLMNYYSVNKSFVDDVHPHMEFGYRKQLSEYWLSMIDYDNNLSEAKREALNRPVEFRSAIINDDPDNSGCFDVIGLVYWTSAIVFFVAAGYVLITKCLPTLLISSGNGKVDRKEYYDL